MAWPVLAEAVAVLMVIGPNEESDSGTCTLAPLLAW